MVVYMRISVADPGIRGGDRIVLTSLTRHIFLHVQSQDLDLKRHMSWSFLYSMVRSERSVLLILVEL